MRFKTTLIFLAGIAVGGVFAFVFLGFLSDHGRTPLPPKANKSEWLASPPAELQGEAAKASNKGEDKERALVVGVIGPETGAEAEYGLAVLEGIVMAADGFNARGGLRGEKIEVIPPTTTAAAPGRRSISPPR